MRIQDVFLLLFVMIGTAVITFFACQIDRKRDMLKCTVVRVVETDEDEPTAKGTLKPPYSIVQYSPQWEVFTVPGILGDEGQTVKVDPSLAR